MDAWNLLSGNWAYTSRSAAQAMEGVILLAGGEGRRFGKPKLLASTPWGESFLCLSLSRLCTPCPVERVIIAVKEAHMPWLELPKRGCSIGILVDPDSLPPGPMAPILWLTLAGSWRSFAVTTIDSPGVSGCLLWRLAEALKGSGASVPLDCSGDLAYPPVYLRLDDYALEALELLVALWRRGWREPRLSDLLRASPVIEATMLGELGARSWELASINRIKDLPLLLSIEEPVCAGRRRISGHRDFFLRALLSLIRGDGIEAIRYFEKEASIYRAAGAMLLEYHALLDRDRSSIQPRDHD